MTECEKLKKEISELRVFIISQGEVVNNLHGKIFKLKNRIKELEKK